MKLLRQAVLTASICLIPLSLIGSETVSATWVNEKEMSLMEAISKDNSKAVASYDGSVNFIYTTTPAGINQTPLSYAIARSSRAIIGILLAKGATLDAKSISEAQRIGDPEIIATLQNFFGEKAVELKVEKIENVREIEIISSDIAQGDSSRR